MNPFEMVVLIVAIIVIAAVVRARHHSAIADRSADSGADAARLAEEVRRLKERVAVLERIATDPGAGLEREIDQLRDR